MSDGEEKHSRSVAGANKTIILEIKLRLLMINTANVGYLDRWRTTKTRSLENFAVSYLTILITLAAE